MNKRKEEKIKIFELSDEEKAAIKNEMQHYEDPFAASIQALKIVQKKRGWVSNEAIVSIGDILGVSTTDIEGVATFYSQIFRQPVGRHIIRYCDSIVCYIMGYQKIQSVIKKHLNIQPGQTTSDKRFTLLPTCCLGNCDKAPAIMIDEDDHTHLTPELILNILERYE